MKQTVIIQVLNRLETKCFRINFDPERPEAAQIIAFMEANDFSKNKYELHKCFEYNPKTQFWIPRFDLVEICTLSLEKEIQNEKL